MPIGGKGGKRSLEISGYIGRGLELQRLHSRAFIWIVAMAVAIAAPSVGRACGFAADQSRILHEELPDVPDGSIAAKVEIIHAGSNFDDEKRFVDDDQVRARIIAVLHGSLKGDSLLIARRGTSCDIWPKVGDQGIAVGKVLSRSGETVLVNVIRAPSGHEMMERWRHAQRMRTAYIWGLLTAGLVLAWWLTRRILLRRRTH